MENPIPPAPFVQNNAAEGSISDSIESKILNIRGKQVMLDRDLAELYGVETKVLNQSVKRNIERFPERYRLQLTDNEFNKLVTICDRFRNLKHSTSLPYAFTEEGVSMLATVLKSNIAVEISIQIMDAFVSMRHFLVSNAGIYQRVANLERHQLETDVKIDHVLDCLESGTLKEKAHIFSEGQLYEAKLFISDLISRAKQRVILVDGYLGPNTFSLLEARQDGVKAIIYTDRLRSDTTLLATQYNDEYPTKPIEIHEWNTAQHDRWLIIDNELWHCGASIKDAGRKTFAIDHISLDVSLILNQLSCPNC